MCAEFLEMPAEPQEDIKIKDHKKHFEHLWPPQFRTANYVEIVRVLRNADQAYSVIMKIPHAISFDCINIRKVRSETCIDIWHLQIRS